MLLVVSSRTPSSRSNVSSFDQMSSCPHISEFVRSDQGLLSGLTESKAKILRDRASTTGERVSASEAHHASTPQKRKSFGGIASTAKRQKLDIETADSLQEFYEGISRDELVELVRDGISQTSVSGTQTGIAKGSHSATDTDSCTDEERHFLKLFGDLRQALRDKEAARNQQLSVKDQTSEAQRSRNTYCARKRSEVREFTLCHIRRTAYP